MSRRAHFIEYRIQCMVFDRRGSLQNKNTYQVVVPDKHRNQNQHGKDPAACNRAELCIDSKLLDR